jgi:hypothetical protein
MLVERSDLDGSRLIQPGKPDVWLMFHGRRHRVVSPTVYDNLWSEVEGLTPREDIPDIAMGPELNEGTCLIRAEGTLPIYLLTGFPAVRRLFVPTYETLLAFGFDEARVKTVPPLVMEAVSPGPDLEAAGDRRAGEGGPRHG